MTMDDKISPLKFLDCALRLLVVPLTIASLWLTVTNHQDSSDYGELKFSSIMSLKYMVSISAISASYALFTALASWIRFLATKAWFFFVSDQIMAYLMVTSGAAMAEILYLVYYGDQKVTWSDACSSYGKFCSRLKLVITFHVLAICCFFILAIISAYRVFSKFDPPSKEEERT